ncbi:MAG: hypothetical protein V4461_10990 [Pseudomonadota bacterium]
MSDTKSAAIDYDNDRIAVRHPEGHFWEGVERDDDGNLLVPILDVPGLLERGYVIVKS